MTKLTSNEKRSLSLQASWIDRKAVGEQSNLADREHHPRNRAVITPAGRFASIALAADHHGVTKQAIQYRLDSNKFGYRYEE